MDAVELAQFGQIHPEVAEARKLRQDVFIAEFDLEKLYDLGLRRIRPSALGKYPAVERDFSFVFADEVPFIEMKKSVWNLVIKEVRELQPVEIFRGGLIPAGKYSVLLRVKFEAKDRTLRDDELAEWSGKIVAALTKLGGTQRA
jgi:phenylalanyl-tRNA synthetase beta chain